MAGPLLYFSLLSLLLNIEKVKTKFIVQKSVDSYFFTVSFTFGVPKSKNAKMRLHAGVSIWRHFKNIFRIIFFAYFFDFKRQIFLWFFEFLNWTQHHPCIPPLRKWWNNFLRRRNMIQDETCRTWTKSSIDVDE